MTHSGCELCLWYRAVIKGNPPSHYFTDPSSFIQFGCLTRPLQELYQRRRDARGVKAGYAQAEVSVAMSDAHRHGDAVYALPTPLCPCRWMWTETTLREKPAVFTDPLIFTANLVWMTTGYLSLQKPLIKSWNLFFVEMHFLFVLYLSLVGCI